MCTMSQCQQARGGWVQFQTQWGVHRGIVEEVGNKGVLMRVPRQYAPQGLAGDQRLHGTDRDRLDMALAQWGYGPPGVVPGAPGYRPWGGVPGYGVGRGYAGWWGGGWWFWWLGFALIFALAFLWW